MLNNWSNFGFISRYYATKRIIWTQEDSDKLIRLVNRHGRRWTYLGTHFPDRHPTTLSNKYADLVSSTK
jgi:hypothetical protein